MATMATMATMASSKLGDMLPTAMRDQLGQWLDAAQLLTGMRDPRVLRALGPSGIRGMVFRRGKQGVPTQMPSGHEAHFDWSYPHDNEEMASLYRRAKAGQWDADQLPWGTDVDPLNPEVPLVPDDFLDWEALSALGVTLDAGERRRLLYSLGTWMLSQFLHGEQGALFAAAQVTESVQFFEGKMYGATQVMDEGRHVEVFRRYLETKMHRIYQINDNLYVVIDALMRDSRWDMKFLGMQIMIEGLALGAFGVLYKRTREPLLRELLKNVIQDEARHVHYGVVALREHFREHLSDRERTEREDWAFEVALLLRSRFDSMEIYDEWFSGRMSRAQWKRFVGQSPGMADFRRTMFQRMVPNLREIGLLSARLLPHYEREGLLEYQHGLAADRLDGAQLLADLQG